MTQTPDQDSSHNNNGQYSDFNKTKVGKQNPAVSDSPNCLFFSKQEKENEPASTALESESITTTKPNKQTITKRRVQKKATAILFAIGTLPIFCIGIIAYSVANRSITEKIRQTQLFRTQEMANSFSNFMVNRYHEAELISSESIFTDSQLWQNATPIQKKAILDRFQSTFNFYQSLVFLDLNGNKLFQSDPNRKILIGKSSEEGSYLDSNKSYPSNYSTQDSYQKAIKTGRIIINNLNTFKGLEFFVPVKQDGQIFGVILLRLKGSKIHQLFSNYKQTKTQWQLINPEGIVFASSSKRHLEQPAKSYLPNFSQLRAFNKSAVEIQVNPIEKSKDLIAYVPINFKGEMPDLNVGAMITLDTDIAFLTQARLLRLLLLGSIFAAILLGIIVVLIYNWNSPLSIAQENVKGKTKQGEIKWVKNEIPQLSESEKVTADTFKQIVIKVQAVAEEIRENTSKYEPYIQSLLGRLRQQTEKISMALVGIEKMAESSLNVTVKTAQTKAAVIEATQKVQAEDNNMQQIVEEIKAIQKKDLAIVKKVERLGGSSQKISQVINLINSELEQIKLLALNASIEASKIRAEGRRNFGLVANEVRSRSSESAEALTEIESIITKIQIVVKELVVALKEDTEQLGAETKLVDETRRSLETIVLTSGKINDLVEDITKASLAQSQSSKAVIPTMSQVEEIVNKTTEEATELSNFFKQLRTVEAELQEIVTKFTVN